MEEKELPLLPNEEISQATFYERQINSLREELTTTEEALEIERKEVTKFQEKSEEWGKRQKQELLDRIKQLEAENSNYKEEVQRLKVQLELKMLAEMVFEKINFGKQFRICNILYINRHKKATQNFDYWVKVFK